MARYENKKMSRKYDPETGSDVYQTERAGAAYDLSSMRFLWRGVDTIRQLYNCSVRPDVFDQISNHWDNKTSDVITIGGIDWKLSSSGKKSGYKYILKNLNYGFVVLLKSFYCELDEHGPHLKIEATPQVIYELGLERLTIELRGIASLFGDTLEASGVAVHLALDVKGLDIPDNFERNLVCRSKRQMSVSGIQSMHFDNMASASFTYGDKETFMFGQSSSLQFCLYNKSKECVASDKADFMEMLWRDTPSLQDPFTSEYNDGRETGEPDTVHRLEFRLHHSVIKQFENGQFNRTQEVDGEGNVIKAGELVHIREARDLKRHLDGLWSYCLNNFRLQHSTSYVHPIWQKIESDVNWFGFDDEFLYVRDQKKTPGIVGRRNVAMMIGNMLRLAARKGLTSEHCTNKILSLGLDSDIADYFGLRAFGDSEQVFQCLFDFVDSRLTEHRLNGVSGHNWSTASV
jgi:hypothetical protein